MSRHGPTLLHPPDMCGSPACSAVAAGVCRVGIILSAPGAAAQGLMRISDYQRRRILALIKHFRVARQVPPSTTAGTTCSFITSIAQPIVCR